MSLPAGRSEVKRGRTAYQILIGAADSSAETPPIYGRTIRRAGDFTALASFVYRVGWSAFAVHGAGRPP